MPIYAYRCESCGFEKDVLQKLSDTPLTQCPQCGAEAFRKQVTAAGFQLKGSGWYVTDFRGGNGSKAASNGASNEATGDGANSGANASGKNGNAEGGSAGASSEGGKSGSPDSAAAASSKPAATP